MKYFLPLLFAFFCGIFIFCYKNEIILIRFGHQTSMHSMRSIDKKTCCFYFWHNYRWCKEEEVILWDPDNMIENCHQLIARWISLAENIRLITSQTILKSTILDQKNQEIFLSFNKSFLPVSLATYDKLMIIEGMLKTVEKNGITFRSYNFLVNHAYMKDSHLDFSISWPLKGFIES